MIYRDSKKWKSDKCNTFAYGFSIYHFFLYIINMKITLTRKEVTKILVDNLIINGFIRNNGKPVTVTYTMVNEDEDGFSVTVEEHNV